MSSAAYPVSRVGGERKPGRFTTLPEYRRQRTDVDRPKICHVLARVAGMASPASDDDDLATDFAIGTPWLTTVLGSGCLNLPDSPALTEQSLADAVEQHVGLMVKRDARLDSFPLEAKQLAPEASARIVRNFVARLHADRFHRRRIAAVEQPPEDDPGTHPLKDDPGASPVSSEASGTEPVPEPLAIRLALVTVLTTRTFYTLKARSDDPLGRWEDDEASALDREIGGWHAEDGWTPKELVDYTRFNLGRLSAELDAEMLRLDDKGDAASEQQIELLRPLDKLTKAVASGFHGGSTTLRMSNLRTLTEVTWYLLTRASAVYPGWTDLLLSLMLEDSRSNELADRSGRPRPSFLDVRSAAEAVEVLLLPPTKASLGEWRRGDDSRRDNLYRSCAEVLVCQQRLLDPFVTDLVGSEHPPAATSVVTSFDLELLMALWQTCEPGQRFHVVAPFHLRQSVQDHTGSLCWLRGTFEVTASLDDHEDDEAALRALTHAVDWKLLHPDVPPEDLLSGPHVVFLNGCPLLAAPLLDDWPVLRAELEAHTLRVPRSAFLEHAVTVDEYLAYRQAEAELIWLFEPQRNTRSKKARALPSLLVGTAQNAREDGPNRRFWLMLGVPIGDAAIRHKVMSQMTARSIMRMMSAAADTTTGDADNQAAGPEPAPETPRSGRDGLLDSFAGYTGPQPSSLHLDGVVVNDRLDDDDASLLYWLGLDVLTISAEKLVDDLAHYSLHLRTRTRIQGDGPCSARAEAS